MDADDRPSDVNGVCIGFRHNDELLLCSARENETNMMGNPSFSSGCFIGGCIASLLNTW